MLSISYSECYFMYSNYSDKNVNGCFTFYIQWRFNVFPIFYTVQSVFWTWCDVVITRLKTVNWRSIMNNPIQRCELLAQINQSSVDLLWFKSLLGVITGCILPIDHSVLLLWIQTSLSHKPEIVFNLSKWIIWAYSFATKRWQVF